MSDTALRREIRQARARARDENKDVLLDFVAPWCEDCREVVRVSRLDPARRVLHDRYVTVYVDVGQFDAHRALMRTYHIDRIATLIVLDPDGHLVARTAAEPISRHEPLTSAALAAWLRHPQHTPPLERPSAPMAPHDAPATKKPPLFPADVSAHH